MDGINMMSPLVSLPSPSEMKLTWDEAKNGQSNVDEKVTVAA
jgi:hypothetical protein